MGAGASSASAGPGRHRPSASRCSSPCTSRPTARRWPWRAAVRCGTQLGQTARLHRRRPQHLHRFVEHADAARLSHIAILASRILRCRGDGPVGSTGRSTLAEKVWDEHLVRKAEGPEPDLLYIDLHLVHEVTSPQAFDGLRLAGRPVRRPDLTIATEDHNVPTLDVVAPIADPVSRHPGRDPAPQLRRVRRPALPDGRPRAGHRARRRTAARPHPARDDGRLRRLPHLHARCLRRARVRHRHQRGRARARHADPAAQAVQDHGDHRHLETATLRPGVTSKDIILAVIAKIGTGGGQGYVLEYRGDAIGTSRWKPG